MGSRALNITIITFWLGTMAWLMACKVLPPLLLGDPPNYRQIVQRSTDSPPVCWKIAINDRTVGWAMTKTSRRPDQMIAVNSRVYLSQISLAQFTPSWVGGFLKSAIKKIGELDLDARGLILLDPVGRPNSFETTVRTEQFPEAICVRGQLDGNRLKFHVSSRDGGPGYLGETVVASDEAVGDALTPQSELPNLRLGQTWTIPIYSPFRAGSNPCEIYQAKVEEEDSLVWGRGEVRTLVVVFRADSGSGFKKSDDVRGRLWVSSDGHVLQQETSMLNCKMIFKRVGYRESSRIVDQLQDNWTGDLTADKGDEILGELK
jgi:hypothetical protein